MSSTKSLPFIHYYSTLICLGLLLTSFIQSFKNPSSLTTTLLLLPLPFYFFRRSLRLTKSWHTTAPAFNWGLCITLTLFAIAFVLTLTRAAAPGAMAMGGAL